MALTPTLNSAVLTVTPYPTTTTLAVPTISILQTIIPSTSSAQFEVFVNLLKEKLLPTSTHYVVTPQNPKETLHANVRYGPEMGTNNPNGFERRSKPNFASVSYGPSGRMKVTKRRLPMESLISTRSTVNGG